MTELLTQTKEKILDHYRCVQATMSELPFYCSHIDVELVGWQNLYEKDKTTEHWCSIGILITPWCMNVIVVPNHEILNALPNAQKFPAVGETWQVVLNGGVFEFTCADDMGFGQFASGSLISVMQQFDHQTAAVSFAEESLYMLLNLPGNTDNKNNSNNGKKLSRRALFAQLLPVS